MKALWVQMIDVYVVFQFKKKCYRGNEIILGEVMNTVWYYLHFLH